MFKILHVIFYGVYKYSNMAATSETNDTKTANIETNDKKTGVPVEKIDTKMEIVWTISEVPIDKTDTKTEIVQTVSEVPIKKDDTKTADHETKMTQRQFIKKLANDLYDYCSCYHQNKYSPMAIYERTCSIIDFLKDHMHDPDEKLLDFLSNANVFEPNLSNHLLWKDSQWPNLTEGPMHDPKSQEVCDAFEFMGMIEGITGKFSKYFDY